LFRRRTFAISVMYVRAGQASLHEVLTNSNCSSDYCDFIQSIGWQIEVDKHTGFSGGLVANITGPVAPYFASFSDEIIFQVASLMPIENMTYIKHLISNCKVRASLSGRSKTWFDSSV
jgi:hypothetical protein